MKELLRLLIIVLILAILFILCLIWVSQIEPDKNGLLRGGDTTYVIYEYEHKQLVDEVPAYLFDDPEIVMEVTLATPCQAIEEPQKKVDVFVNYAKKYHLTRQSGVFNGPSGKETYYNLDMSRCIGIMRSIGFSEEEYPYWVRPDGAKMLGDYVMCAAELNTRPRGTVLKTSMGLAIVVDTGSFAYGNPSQIDICTTW